MENEPTQYYWCVNCGNHGNFGKLRVRSVNCESCGYENITPFTKDEILESEDLKLKFGVSDENTTVSGS